MFDEIGCEEFYGPDYEAELQEILLEAANFRLQEIAADMAEARAEFEADELYLGAQDE